MSHYHDPADFDQFGTLRAGAPDAASAYRKFSSTAIEAETRIMPRKYRELIAVATALTTQCVYCIEAHTQAAKRAGATIEELSETVYVTAAIRAGGAFAHGLMATKFFVAADAVAETAADA